ncbi:hypothetical protein SCP_0307360 [Sparassis crispa]|uniref:Uncharacterized protein n=1 Tax=Sparassis crispa TaxID=139825 RepID=A0A401GFY4_9APHY|nr:hypothetical protein SCP_0307360 [Sparassis crispa]GBE81013.1 hypothetical protein SCP_0307360 [Sparassis crispa]
MLVGSSQHGAQSEHSSPLSGFKFTIIGQPPALLQRLGPAQEDSQYSSPSPPSLTSELPSAQEAPRTRPSLLEALSNSGDIILNAEDSSNSLLVPVFPENASTEPPHQPSLVPSPHNTVSQISMTSIRADHTLAGSPRTPTVPATNDDTRTNDYVPIGKGDTTAVLQEHTHLSRPSPSPDLFTFLSLLTQEQADWDEIRNLKEKYQDEYKELLLRKDETQRAVQRELDQANKLFALAESALEKMELLRLKQDQRLSSEKHKAEALAAEAAKLLEQRDQAELQKAMDERRRNEAERQMEEKRQQETAAAEAEAAAEQDRLRKLEEQRASEEANKRRCEEEGRLKAEEDGRRKTKEREAVFVRAQEEKRLQEQEAEEREKLRQQELRKAKVMEQKKAAAADNAARSRAAQLKAKLEKEKSEANSQLSAPPPLPPSTTSISTPPGKERHVATAPTNASSAKAPPYQSSGIVPAAPPPPSLPTMQASLPARPAIDAFGAEPTKSQRSRGAKQPVRVTNPPTALADPSGVPGRSLLTQKGVRLHSTSSRVALPHPAIQGEVLPSSAAETSQRVHTVKIEQLTSDIPRSTGVSNSDALSHKPPSDHEELLDSEDLHSQLKSRPISSLPSRNGASTSSASQLQSNVSSRLLTAKGTHSDPFQASGTGSAPPSDRNPSIAGSKVPEADGVACQSAAPQIPSSELRALAVNGGSSIMPGKLPSPGHSHMMDGGWSSYYHDDPWVNTPRAERMSPIEDRVPEKGDRSLQTDGVLGRPAGDHWSPSPDRGRDLQPRHRGDFVSPQDRHPRGPTIRNHNPAPGPTRKRRRENDDPWLSNEQPPLHRRRPAEMAQETRRIPGAQTRPVEPRSPSPLPPRMYDPRLRSPTTYSARDAVYVGDPAYPDYPSDLLPRNDNWFFPSAYDANGSQPYDYYASQDERRLVSGPAASDSVAQSSSVQDRPGNHSSVAESEYLHDQGRSSLLRRMKAPERRQAGGSTRNDNDDWADHLSYSPPLRASQRGRGATNRSRGNSTASKGSGRQQRPTLQDRLSTNSKQNGKTSDLGARLS